MMGDAEHKKYTHSFMYSLSLSASSGESTSPGGNWINSLFVSACQPQGKQRWNELPCRMKFSLEFNFEDIWFFVFGFQTSFQEKNFRRFHDRCLKHYILQFLCLQYFPHCATRDYNSKWVRFSREERIPLRIVFLQMIDFYFPNNCYTCMKSFLCFDLGKEIQLL